MKGYYAIRSRETGENYQVLMPCGQLRDKMFDSKIAALMFLHAHQLSEDSFEVVFVEVGKGVVDDV